MQARQIANRQRSFTPASAKRGNHLGDSEIGNEDVRSAAKEPVHFGTIGFMNIDFRQRARIEINGPGHCCRH